ncbi:MAG: hypothetical protein HQ559_11360 [Lentisphaerae bacterium]|nr:hypothetical protein [Lentisphaerota bacterium]
MPEPAGYRIRNRRTAWIKDGNTTLLMINIGEADVEAMVNGRALSLPPGEIVILPPDALERIVETACGLRRS